MGNGQGLHISSIGSSKFLSHFHPNDVALKLNDLLLVPSITKNLVSVSKFAKDNNVYFEFHCSHCFVKCQVSNNVLLKGQVGLDGLYCFQHRQFLPKYASQVQSQFSSTPHVHTITKSNNSALDADCSTFTVWHRHLGHAHSSAVRSVLDLCKVTYQSKTISDFCNACCLGKAHRINAPPSQTIYTKSFELILNDLWGPSPYLSTYGYSYYITFVDAFTRYTWIYFLKKKSDAFAAFTQFYMLVKTQFSATLKAIQTDWGGEFRVFTKYLNEQGIIHRLTCPHTSHQNGIVERKHRQIVEMGLTLLAQSHLPHKFWDHSFTAAIHLINRLPTSAATQFTSRFHALFNKLPDYQILRIFGCACFPFLRPYNQHKWTLDPKNAFTYDCHLSTKGTNVLLQMAKFIFQKMSCSMNSGFLILQCFQIHLILLQFNPPYPHTSLGSSFFFH